jgi:hypothetical protein
MATRGTSRWFKLTVCAALAAAAALYVRGVDAQGIPAYSTINFKGRIVARAPVPFKNGEVSKDGRPRWIEVVETDGATQWKEIDASLEQCLPQATDGDTRTCAAMPARELNAEATEIQQALQGLWELVDVVDRETEYENLRCKALDGSTSKPPHIDPVGVTSVFVRKASGSTPVPCRQLVVYTTHAPKEFAAQPEAQPSDVRSVLVDSKTWKVLKASPGVFTFQTGFVELDHDAMGPNSKCAHFDKLSELEKFLSLN